MDKKIILHVMRQTLGKAKNVEAFIKSAINLYDSGEKEKAISLIKTIKEVQNEHNKIFQAQIDKIQSSLPSTYKNKKSNPLIVTPELKDVPLFEENQRETTDIDDFYPLKRGLTKQDREEKIYFDVEPPKETFEPSAPPLTDEYYS